MKAIAFNIQIFKTLIVNVNVHVFFSQTHEIATTLCLEGLEQERWI